MTADRIKEIQHATVYPDSISVQQALLQVWNECEQKIMFSEKYMIEFGEWVRNNPKIWNYPNKINDKRTTKELLQLWKEQKLRNK